jgi:hypothetical protein
MCVPSNRAKGELRTKATQIAKDELIYDTDESVKFQERVLQGRCRQQNLLTTRERVPDRDSSLIRRLVNIPEPMCFANND